MEVVYRPSGGGGDNWRAVCPEGFEYGVLVWWLGNEVRDMEEYGGDVGDGDNCLGSWVHWLAYILTGKGRPE